MLIMQGLRHCYTPAYVLAYTAEIVGLGCYINVGWDEATAQSQQHPKKNICETINAQN